MQKYRYNKITQEQFDKGLNLIKANEGTVEVTDSNKNLYQFTCSGIEGAFAFSDGNLEIGITDKPWYVSWVTIQNKLDEFFVG